MARIGRKLDVDHVEVLISERELTIREIARKMARAHYRGRTPTTIEVEKERRNVQRWLNGGGVEDPGLRRFARALGEQPDSLVLPPEPEIEPVETQPAPVGIMREALANQVAMREDYEAIRDRLESLEDRVGTVVELVTQVLEEMRGGESRGQASR